MANDFKFGAKIKLFGEHEINIRPNPDHPMLVEYHDPSGIAVKKAFITNKLNIKDGTVKDMIPENTRITDLVYDRNSKEFEIGIVVETGEDFILNRYSDIIEIQEVSMMYKYNPETGSATPEGISEESKESLSEEIEEVVEDFTEEIEEDLGEPSEEDLME